MALLIVLLLLIKATVRYINSPRYQFRWASEALISIYEQVGKCFVAPNGVSSGTKVQPLAAHRSKRQVDFSAQAVMCKQHDQTTLRQRTLLILTKRSFPLRSGNASSTARSGKISGRRCRNSLGWDGSTSIQQDASGVAQ